MDLQFPGPDWNSHVRACAAGFISVIALDSIRQDIMGLEAYEAWSRAHWTGAPWNWVFNAVCVLSALTCIVIAHTEHVAREKAHDEGFDMAFREGVRLSKERWVNEP